MSSSSDILISINSYDLELSKLKIRIVTEKKGWILHRMATEIARLHAETRINRRWPDADIHYFINYGYYKPPKRKSLTVATFTHYDPDHLADIFLDVAKKVDHCVAISESTRTQMIELGVPATKITKILIGADSRYRPVLTLGLAGRTYSGGRKGEALVAEIIKDSDLMDGVEIIATQPGWGVPVHSERDMQNFYRRLDYLLVPSLIEGGPVPFMEALACGVPAIAPPIGVIPEFPHIEYETGNVESLKLVIQKEKERILTPREELARSMKPFNWDNWAQSHIRLFSQLLQQEREG
jgi:glycosyltransferase involved in cell wall biosynthesis